jgi:hypothetical protein
MHGHSCVGGGAPCNTGPDTVGVRAGQLGRYIPDIVICTPVDDDITINSTTITLVAEVVSPSSAKPTGWKNPPSTPPPASPCTGASNSPPAAPPVIYCYELDNGVYTLTATADTTATITTHITVTLDLTALVAQRT